MAGIDPYNVLPQAPQEIMGVPRPMYDVFGAGQLGNNPMAMQMALMAPQLMQQFFGIDKFIPQQTPAQNMLDQMTSYKYMQDSARSRENMREIDQQSLYGRIQDTRETLGFGRATGVGAAQVNNAAGMLATDTAQSLLGMVIGPQNVEDAFFGRRGSAVQFSNAVSQFGFYRPDSVSGGDRMSGESLQQFTEQLYSNMYGPGTNMSDVSGLSAGRMGTVANELAQRGILPQSIGSMSAAKKMSVLRDESLRPPDFEQTIAKELADETFKLQDIEFDTPDGKKVKYADLDRESQQEILTKETANADSSYRRAASKVSATMSDENASFEDVVNLPGGASGVRKVDASRVGNTLKEYAGVVASVREIFGDNGMSNAPMAQLIAALDALSQGGLSAANPGKLENIMRRTQMASRDSGVSLEALMGLTARGGAIADQNGLDRSAVPEAVIGAMERGRAMRDTGAFAPGFGKMDANAATLFALDQNIRSDASNTSRMAQVANRLVKENKGNKDFEGRAGDLMNFVAAMESGSSTFVNAAGDTVNIAQEMGQNPGAFFQKMFSSAGVTEQEISARMYDATNTQEYLIPGQVAAAQRYEATQAVGSSFAQDFLRQDKGKNLTQEQRTAIAASMGESFSAAMIDDVDTSMDPAERVKVLQSSMRRGVEKYVRSQDAFKNATEEQIQAETTRLFTGPDGIFKDEQDAFSYAGVAQAEAGRSFEGRTGMNINKFRQVSSLEVAAETESRGRRNRAKAELASTIGLGGDGSNFLQRLSDALVDGGSQAEIVAAALGAVDTVQNQERLIDAVGGRGVFDSAMGVISDEYKAAVIDTDVEKNAEISRATQPVKGAAGRAFETESRKQAFAQFKAKFDGSPGGAAAVAQYDTAIANQELVQNILDTGVNKETREEQQSAAMTVIRSMYTAQIRAANKDKDPAAVEAEVAATFADPAKRQQAVAQVVGGKNFKRVFTEELAQKGVGQQALNEIGLGQNVMTEAQMNEQLELRRVVAGDTLEERKANSERLAKLDTMSREMGAGKLSAGTILDVMGEGIATDKREGVEKAMTAALENFNDKQTNEKGEKIGTMKELQEQLTSSGMAEPQIQKIMDMVNLARGQSVIGGFNSLSKEAIGAEITQTARVNALLQAGVTTGGKLSELTSNYRAAAEGSEEQKVAMAELRTAAGVSEEEFKDELNRTSLTPEQKEKLNEQVAREKAAAGVVEEGQAGPGGGGLLDGIVGSLGTAISSAFDKAIADNFKDLKIENVTITNLKLDGAALVGALFSGLTKGADGKTAEASATAAATKEGVPGKTDVAAADSKKDGAAATSKDAKASDEKDAAEKTARSGQKATDIDQIVAFIKNAYSAISQAPGASKGTSDAGATEFTGRLTFTGLETAIVHLIPKNFEPTPDNGAPVFPTTS
jgi:hypothetical protein